MSSLHTSSGTSRNHVVHEADEQRANLIGHHLVTRGVRVHAVAEHLRRETVLLGAVGDDDGGLGSVLALDPARDLGVEGIDAGGGEG